jgi:proteasome beta subunit
MPFFDPPIDPGSNFPELLRRIGLGDGQPTHAGEGTIDVPHATTCVALRFADGVVMAGDRRATSGNLISHRSMDKVVEADMYSGVAIAGAAGPAMEMIRLFQLQLEHYEKVEGSHLSLEGKANQSMMVRSNLPSVGLVVVPLFGGYDLAGCKAGCGPTTLGGRYEERLRRRRVRQPRCRYRRQVGYRTGLSRDAINPRCAALGAADADSATGGPDVLRGIYPTVATVTAEGWQQVNDDELAARFEAIAAELRTR